MRFQDERDLEGYVRRKIRTQIARGNPEVYALESKKAVDIIVCREAPTPALFFLEVKYHNPGHGRLGFGQAKGGGFQPELLARKPVYFEKHLRWVLASELHSPGKLWLVNSETIRNYVAGGCVGPKFNNIQTKLFTEVPPLSPTEFLRQLSDWLSSK